MRAYVLAHHPGDFPRTLLPYNGAAVINCVVNEVLLQKQIDHICIVTNEMTQALVQKHLTAAYPDSQFTYVSQIGEEEGEYLVLDGAVATSLRLQDLIRYYQQFKTITYAAYDKTSPKPIPFTVYPVQPRRGLKETHTYNCGSGFLTCF